MFLRLCCVLLLLASSPSLQASAELEESDITNLDRAGTIADLKGCNNQTVDRVEALGGSDSKEKKKKQREKEKREKKKARKKRRREKRRKRKEEKEKEKENDRFTPAKPLDFFRDIDPSIFKWSNPDQIQPGTTTCGTYAPVEFLERFLERRPRSISVLARANPVLYVHAPTHALTLSHGLHNFPAKFQDSYTRLSGRIPN